MKSKKKKRVTVLVLERDKGSLSTVWKEIKYFLESQNSRRTWIVPFPFPFPFPSPLFFSFYTFISNPNKSFSSHILFSQELLNIVRFWGQVSALLLPFPTFFTEVLQSFRSPLPLLLEQPYNSRAAETSRRCLCQALKASAEMLWAESGGDAILPPRSATILPRTLPLSRIPRTQRAQAKSVMTLVPSAPCHCSPPTHTLLCFVLMQWDITLRHFFNTWIPELGTQTRLSFPRICHGWLIVSNWHLPRSPLRQGHQ